jgi:hypothetical protein
MDNLGFNLKIYHVVSEIICLFALQRESDNIFRGSETKTPKGQTRKMEFFPVKREKCSHSVLISIPCHLYSLFSK